MLGNKSIIILIKSKVLKNMDIKVVRHNQML